VSGLREIRVPGDKSVSHRALLFAALAEGESRLRGLLPGADCQGTAAALRAMGVAVPDLPADGSEIRVVGVGLRGLRTPDAPIDCGNSGTTARLLLGILGGARLPAVLDGDPSLRSRPMRRVTRPLEAMGSRFHEEGEPDRLPIRVLAEGEFRGGRWVLPVASAQVKSALLLAGLLSGRPVEVEESGRSRDHTERMLRAMGVPLESRQVGGDGVGARWICRVPGGVARLDPLDLDVPGDPSSAAFVLALGAMGGAGGGLRVRGVGLNPTRIGFLPVLERMGVELRVEASGDDGVGEPVGNIEVRASRLQATTIGGPEVPTLIDELPLLAALAARAHGVTRIRNAAELRVKESDRIAVTARNLRALGVEVEEYPDGLDVHGAPDDSPFRGAIVVQHDHRIAMAFGVLGALPGASVTVNDPDAVEVSFPGFWDLLASVSEAGSPAPGSRARPPVVTIDGPAGSGKSTTARAVAARLGFAHLDSGALYRAVTLALLESGRPEETWADLTVGELEAFDVALVRTPEGLAVRIGGVDPGDALRSARVTGRVSGVAALPAVRDWLLGAQRAAGREGGLVADGRDMGTVVFPDAEVKVFLVAELEERARRRLAEQGGGDDAEAVGAEAERIARRDRDDSTRETAPLLKAPDAIEIDTTGLTVEDQVTGVVELVEARGRPRHKG
jgi:3-phosphoshikimate 1-carboxyvinyltransferase